jgi:hypothetical protein
VDADGNDGVILSRGIGSPLLTELAKPVFHPVVLVNLDWPSGEVWAHSNRGTITWDGHDWLGVGDFASFSVPEEAAGLVPGQGSITIIGTLADVLDANDEEVKNRRALIYSGAVTVAGGNTLIGTPFSVFSGYMDGTLFRLDVDGTGKQVYALQLTLGSGPGARLGASITHSFEDQQSDYPTDTAGRHTQLAVPGLRSLTWPE